MLTSKLENSHGRCAVSHHRHGPQTAKENWNRTSPTAPVCRCTAATAVEAAETVPTSASMHSAKRPRCHQARSCQRDDRQWPAWEAAGARTRLASTAKGRRSAAQAASMEPTSRTALSVALRACEALPVNSAHADLPSTILQTSHSSQTAATTPVVFGRLYPCQPKTAAAVAMTPASTARSRLSRVQRPARRTAASSPPKTPPL
mmetsp:Transcript_40756/g.128244  ORF Transcript_40756/g.128244 Transcript_40756/m.128244 type:complete len:204 (-) Transcript_40756:68-679(-)